MSSLSIQDLGQDNDLDQEAMRSCLGGRGLGRSALFNFFLPTSSVAAPAVTQNIFNIDADTVQFNQLNQIVDIANSTNVVTNLAGDQDNQNFKFFNPLTPA